MRRTWILVLFVVALALVATGCGSSNNDNSGGGGASTAAQTKSTASSSGGGTEVRIQNFAFSPDPIKAKVGQKIVWQNDDTVAHNVVATSGGDFKSDTLNKGAKFEFTPTKAGTIQYVCTFHAQMKATIEVS